MFYNRSTASKNRRIRDRFMLRRGRYVLNMRVIVWTQMFIIGSAIISPAHGQRIELDKPLPVVMLKLDRTKVAGKCIAWSAAGFEVRDAEGQVQSVAWDELEPRNVYLTHMRVFGGGSAAQWFELGRLLRGLPEGESWSDRAFREAIKRDAKLAEAVEQAKAVKPAESEPAQDAAAKTPADDEAAAMKAGVNVEGGGQVVGEVESKFWGQQSPAQTAASVQVLKQFAEQTRQQINDRLKLYETDYFLFYTDLNAAEARNWQNLLDRMYSRLLRMFDIPKDSNIWRGKALVFVFRAEADYHRFQMLMHGTNSVGSAGMCHSFGNGFVHIAFFRQPDEMKFAHVLVHESVHGFIHRYRSPVPVLSWVNEGLAEWIAFELVPTGASAAQQRADTQIPIEYLKEKRGFNGMFDLPHIAGWQYPVALDLTRFMIDNKKAGYIKFFNAIKDGEPWEQAFETGFGIGFDRFVAGYGQARGLDNLRR